MIEKEYIFSYGSLLSYDSRLTYSGIEDEVIPADLHGWKRSWSTRHYEESATHAGATKHSNAKINGVLIPTVVTDELRHRERYYEFVRLKPEMIETNCELDESTTFWICEQNSVDFASVEYPIPQSYIDTCLIGCIETNISNFPQKFIHQTEGWEHYWKNDRQQSIRDFPRAAEIDRKMEVQIDELLNDCGVLKFRRD